MSSIYDIAGTTSDSFSLNGKCTLLQGSGKPENYIGKPGDIYLSDTGALYVKGGTLNESTGEMMDDGWLDLVETALPAPNKQGSFPYVSGESYTLSDKSVDNIAFKDDSSYEWLKENIIKTVSGRNIGDIFYTTRLDAELNGAVECNGGIYNTEDFSGNQSIGVLLTGGKLPYVSLEEYSSIVSTNGYCRVFGWNGRTSFRVPTIPALLLTKEEASVVGNGYSLGLNQSGLDEETDYLPLRTGSVGSGGGRTIQWKKEATKTLAGSAFPDGTSVQVENGNLSVGVSKNPEYSGLLSNLPVIEYRAMVQLATGATNDALITATSALQNIANKAESDLSNVSENIDYVVESYVDGTDWYRVYKSGWCEQGGVTEAVESSGYVVTLLKPYKDTNYNVSVTGKTTSRTDRGWNYAHTLTTTNFKTVQVGSGCFWEAKGYIE